MGIPIQIYIFKPKLNNICKNTRFLALAYFNTVNISSPIAFFSGNCKIGEYFNEIIYQNEIIKNKYLNFRHGLWIFVIITNNNSVAVKFPRSVRNVFLLKIWCFQEETVSSQYDCWRREPHYGTLIIKHNKLLLIHHED